CVLAEGAGRRPGRARAHAAGGSQARGGGRRPAARRRLSPHGEVRAILPLGITAEQAAMPTARSGLYGIARLKPGVTAAVARAEMDSIVHATSGYSVTVEPLLQLVTGQEAPALKAAFAAVLLLLV